MSRLRRARETPRGMRGGCPSRSERSREPARWGISCSRRRRARLRLFFPQAARPRSGPRTGATYAFSPRNGDIPVYAWLSGLLAVICDPENSFEWVGVLREIFLVSDADIAAAVRGG